MLVLSNTIFVHIIFLKPVCLNYFCLYECLYVYFSSAGKLLDDIYYFSFLCVYFRILCIYLYRTIQKLYITKLKFLICTRNSIIKNYCLHYGKFSFSYLQNLRPNSGQLCPMCVTKFET